MKKNISIIVPIFNEEEVLPELINRLGKIADAEREYNFEFIMVENGSHDGSFEVLKEKREKDQRIKIVRLSRNFKTDGGITAGLNYARGDVAVIMNADLQDPPEMIPEFLKKWRDGFEIVYGVIKKRHGVNFIRKALSSTFYYVSDKMTKGIFPRNVSDFRLIDRKVIHAVNTIKETNRFMRGIVAWTGFKSVGIEFERPPRFAGESKAHFFAVLRTAMDGIFAFSYFPLRVATFLGILMSTASFFMMIGFIIAYFVLGVIVQGHTSIIVTMLFLFGILFFVLGIIGEYLARIYDEVKARPNYIVSEEIGV